MNNVPLVCVCVPTYNSEATIKETLLSIANQTYSNLLIEIVDNASTDGTVAIAAAIDDARIRIHKHDVNIGAEGNFSRCIQLAKGKYTAIYHADDIYESQMLERQVAFLESQPDAGAVFTEARLVDQNNKFIGEIRMPKAIQSSDQLFDFKSIFKAVLRHSNFLICPSALVRTQVYLEEVKVWRGELFGSGADLDVWLRIARRHSIGFIREPLMRYRIGQSQGSALVRMSTSRGTLFGIVDHYLKDLSVREMLSSQDRTNYARLDRRDRVGRAVNLFLAGEAEHSSRLCNDIYSWSALTAAVQTRRGLMVLALGAYLNILIFFRLNKIGRASLTYIKRLSNT